ncbi:MAG TPA: phenylalanine--tRNA ligase subunit alpha [Chloroflexota bacterium]|nr:phenylalanine--tRNA ligase subunit alpha [Chloroflexota bacterium]
MSSTIKSLAEDLERLGRDALAGLPALDAEPALEEWRIRYLSRNGALAGLMRGLGKLSAEERPAAGATANRVKTALEEAFDRRLSELRAAARAMALESERIDVTLPGRGVRLGDLHPITRIRREIERVYLRLGFSVVEGPEVEWDHFNFTLLNLPPDHPARDMQDTFYVSGVEAEGPAGGRNEVVLRTHTSPVQIRTMLNQKPPIRVIVPGKVFRNEATDASHESMFTQIEGLCVDEHTTMADLRGCLTLMIRSLFGEESQIRFRCGYFPFVEPGAEFDMSCHVCRGSGCRTCKGGWIEIGGCGMVHPIVLENCGIDSTRYTGWAFGFGFERMALLKYGVDDIRLFYGNDQRFIRQLS